MSWTEGSLLHILEVVLVVSVEDQLSKFYGRIICMWPDLGDIKDVPFILQSVNFWHHLHLNSPSSSIPLVDVLEQVLGGIVGIGGFEL
jgi:hypothetical protein